jgi:multiple sugar transport system substrate-binding protein
MDKFSPKFILITLCVLLVACNIINVSETEKPPDETAGQSPTQVVEERVKIHWLIGLDYGSAPGLRWQHEQIANRFNTSQNRIELIVEIIDGADADQKFLEIINGETPPDLIGPIDLQSYQRYLEYWLDLKPYIDQSAPLFDDYPAILHRIIQKDQGQPGLTLNVFPSFLIYNKTLFDQAKLPYPPQQYGTIYLDEQGRQKPWNFDTLSELARKLTLDANGNRADSVRFDSNRIVQFGFGEQWTDARGFATFFGPGSLIATNGKASIPENWKISWKWFYDAMWISWFHPNEKYGSEELFGAGNWFRSGHVAIVHTHLWYLNCCIGDTPGQWDLAAIPMFKNVATAKIQADIFTIYNKTSHSNETFDVLRFLLSPLIVNDLLKIYGGLSAHQSLQTGYFTSKFPDVQGVNWQVVIDSIDHADIPSHTSWMPNHEAFIETTDKFWSQLISKPNLNIDQEISKLEMELQKILDEAEKKDNPN